MKRTLSLALCLILSLALLAGCGAAPLPDGLTQESVTDTAAQTVAQLNDEDDRGRQGRLRRGRGTGKI